MKHPGAAFVIKYFDLIDEFIKVRCSSEELMQELHATPITNKSTYRNRVVRSCVPAFDSDVLTAVKKLDEGYDLEIVEELLYQICIDVNPSLEIHQVSIPQPANAKLVDEPEDLFLPRPGNDTARQGLFRRVGNLDRTLRQQIIGQDEAITALVRAVKKAAVGLKRPTHPVGTFLLVGRTGTGKTELAKAVARNLFDDPSAMIRVDCSEYALPHEYAKLIGAPPGYVGHESGGVLTEALRKEPDCVVLFDEVEKAHPRLHNLLLQVLEEGQLTDGRGRRVDFRRALVLLTSNTGAVEVRDASRRVGFGATEALSQDGAAELTAHALEREFAPELLGRLDERVVFRELDLTDAERIAERLLAELAERARRSRSPVAFAPALARWVAQRGFRPDCGARELRRVIQREIEAPLASHLLAHPRPAGLVKVALQRGALRFRAA